MCVCYSVVACLLSPPLSLRLAICGCCDNNLELTTTTIKTTITNHRFIDSDTSQTPTRTT